eukprot:SAG11_NODE_1227_length_5474_cov_5.294326_3_plen_54_part_00
MSYPYLRTSTDSYYDSEYIYVYVFVVSHANDVITLPVPYGRGCVRYLYESHAL